MKEISLKLRKQALEKLRPFISELVDEGCSQDVIIHKSKAHVDSKIRSYYMSLKEPSMMHSQIRSTVAKLHGQYSSQDSKAEAVFYDMLCKNGIKFKYQYPIGQYRVDYLIGDWLIIELDGPQHEKKRDEIRDKYLQKMGYGVLRVPLPTVALDPDAVIREIKALF